MNKSLSHLSPLRLLPVLALSALAVGCSAGSESAGAKPATQSMADTRHEAQIGTTYALNRHLRRNDLQVSVRNGRATLSGTVEESVSSDLAEQIALGVTGIKTVDNKIKIEPDYQPQANGSFGSAIDDATITAAIKSKLLWSRHADGMTTEVVTRDGRVTLRGTADSTDARQHAQQLARNTGGVNAVDNQIIVRPEASQAKAGLDISGEGASVALSDTWITTKVKSTLLYSSNISSGDISVTTKDGVVKLTGTQPSGAERALAIELAKNVRGVKSVQATGLTI
jgi:hyperosmotically inducible periplasmic protein